MPRSGSTLAEQQPRVAVQAMTEILRRLDGTPGQVASEPERMVYNIRFNEATDPRLGAANE